MNIQYMLSVERDMPPTRTALLALLAAGCTPMEWVRSDATPQQVEADAQQCRQVAQQQLNERYGRYRAFSPWTYRDEYGEPFVLQPIGVFDPYGNRFIEEQRVARV